MSRTGPRLLFSCLLLLALAGCAGTPKPAAVPLDAVPVAGQAVDAATPPLAVDTVPSAPPVVTAADPGATTAEPAADAAQAGIAAGAPTEAEDDYAALYGGAAPQAAAAVAPEAVSYDPWEPMNRRIHAFNNAIDRAVARPIARAYVAVLPVPVRLGVTNFFDNLGSPLTMVNQVLQGRPRDAVQTLGRFVINSTLGIGGVFDPASDLKMKRRSEDFGQTLGIWGWRSSRYVELPLFGPRTVRDVFGLVGDAPLSVTRQVDEDAIRYGLQGLQLVDTRSQLLSLDVMRQDAADDYALVRNAWMQRRTFQIEGDRRRREQSDSLPDYLEEEDPYPTVPADAMPVPIPGG